MAWKQLIKPNLSITDGAGWCLRFARRVYDVPAWKPSAWEQWEATAHKHKNRSIPADVSVPVWFSHWGTYGSPARYGNWGHVVVWVPGRGYLSSPTGGHGQQWYPNIESVERAYSSKFVGWSEDIGGVRVVEAVAADPIGEIMSYYKNKKAFRDDFMHMVVNASMYSGLRDEKGKQIREPIAAAVRRAQRIGRQNRIKNDRIEGKVDALALAIQQLSGGKLDMEAITKAAYEGASKGASDVSAAEVAELLEVSVVSEQDDE